ncbi:Tyrosine-protein phosphatase precursor [Marinovum algicola]|uniref:Protein-tyrosine phosphatase n=1 Tax=Marinovum algicola TaxID=42444 RepID=A0A975ZPB3_9RHOB|nr:tyrosine-protein phosphatase [Marinovum algicola]SEJ82846.1 protein-tyrosine phosphatase [Marinovum algicola]SLN62717.1 Tyrosine-protein phosphatase precursor [Marinovum algicola]
MSIATPKGTLNFRPVAAFRAAGGHLLENSLYRSGAFGDVDAEGIAGLKALGLTTVFDLRAVREQTMTPSPMLNEAGFTIMSRAHDIRHGDLIELLKSENADVDALKGAMSQIYLRMPVEFSAVFGDVFRALIQRGPKLLVHCAAGKDRTGVVVALLLDLLGVSRGDIFADYLLTNQATEALVAKIDQRARAHDLPRMAPDVAVALSQAHADHLEAMFRGVEDSFGTTRDYAVRGLGLSVADIERLQHRLVA